MQEQFLLVLYTVLDELSRSSCTISSGPCGNKDDYHSYRLHITTCMESCFDYNNSGSWPGAQLYCDYFLLIHWSKEETFAN